MDNLNHTGGNWRIRKTVDESGDYPFPTYDIIAVHEYGPQYIGTADQHPGNARMFAGSVLMLKELIANYETYQVLKEMFEVHNPMVWSIIQGAYLTTANDTKKVIELVTDLTIEEVLLND